MIKIEHKTLLNTANDIYFQQCSLKIVAPTLLLLRASLHIKINIKLDLLNTDNNFSFERCDHMGPQICYTYTMTFWSMQACLYTKHYYWYKILRTTGSAYNSSCVVAIRSLLIGHYLTLSVLETSRQKLGISQ